MKNLLKLSCAAAIALSATAAFAQSGRGTDVSGPPGGSVVTFAPLPTSGSPSSGGGAGNGPAFGTITSTAAQMMGGGTTTSPATGNVIPAAAANIVGQLISTGSPAAVAQVTTALLAAGAPAGATTALMNALAALAGATPSSAANLIIAAAQAFDNLVQSAPASFFVTGTLPAEFLAIHAALVRMTNAL